MANTRIIRQNFFNDPIIANKTSIKERYFIIGLACAADDYGRFWADNNNLKSIIFPTDKVALPWILKTLNKLQESDILCFYEDSGIEYGHFLDWFSKGWCLKQRIDHPREFGSPDCPIHQTELFKRKEREISRTIKYNSIQNNKSEMNVVQDNPTIDKIEQFLMSDNYKNQIQEDFPLVKDNLYYEKCGEYLTWVKNHNAFNINHPEQFVVWIEGENERLLEAAEEKEVINE